MEYPGGCGDNIDMRFRDRNGNSVGRFDFEKTVFIEKTSNRPEDFCPVHEVFNAAWRV